MLGSDQRTKGDDVAGKPQRPRPRGSTMSGEGQPPPGVGDAFIENLLGVPGGLAQQRAANAQQQVRNNDEQLGRSAVDPSYVTTPDPPPETMTHQQIWDAAQALDQQALWNLVTGWAQSSTRVANLFQFNKIGVDRAMQGKWESAGADAARAASHKFAKAGEDMGHVAQSVGMRLDALFYSAQALAAAVPPPAVATSPDPDNPAESVLPGLISGEKDRADSEAATQARNQAVAAVKNIYLPVFPPSGENVPAFNPPPAADDDTNPVVLNSNPASPSRGNQEAVTPDSPAVAVDAPQEQTQPASTQLTNSNQTAPASTNPAGLGKPDGSAATPTGPGTTNTTPASTTTASPSTTGPVPSNRPGSTPDRSGLGPGPGPNTESRTGGPGASRPGAPGMPGAASPLAAGGRSAGSTARPPGVMGPGPGVGARRQEDGDHTRRIPDYLIRQQSELADLPPAPPGTIGSEYSLAEYSLADRDAIDYPYPINQVTTAAENVGAPGAVSTNAHAESSLSLPEHNHPLQSASASSPPAPADHATTSDEAGAPSNGSTATSGEVTTSPTSPASTGAQSGTPPIDPASESGQPQPQTDPHDRESSGESRTRSFTLPGPVMDTWDNPPTPDSGNPR